MLETSERSSFCLLLTIKGGLDLCGTVPPSRDHSALGDSDPSGREHPLSGLLVNSNA